MTRGALSTNANVQGFQPDTGDDDEIEILEVVGLDEDSPAARPVESPSDEADEDEITVDFDESSDGAGGIDEPAVTEFDRLARLKADFENFKKRVEREKEANQRQAAAGLVTRILPVLDNFERAISTDVPTEDGRAFQQGVALIFRQLLEELRREGLVAVDSLGQEFDPTVHEAVITDNVPGLPDNTVVEELRRGYLLHERLLRPAQVKVSLGDPEEPDGGSSNGGE
jgi:molecular chaperone GrpE